MYPIRFPLSDVNIRIVDKTKKVANPVFTGLGYLIAQNEFEMEVSGVAHFYAGFGSEIEIALYDHDDTSAVELYLNGSVYGAILYQRSIIPLHGSSFIYNEKGTMLCGESGSGKSSITASFYQSGAKFITDDISPVIMVEEKPCIWANSDRIKLWRDSLVQLGHSADNLQSIDKETEKFYWPLDSEKDKHLPLHHVIVLELSTNPDPEFVELSGSDKLLSLLDHIYRVEYLQGMPANENIYFKNILNVASNVRVTMVLRPKSISISDFRKYLQEYILIPKI